MLRQMARQRQVRTRKPEKNLETEVAEGENQHARDD
jgi:hypothetical protein